MSLADFICEMFNEGLQDDINPINTRIKRLQALIDGKSGDTEAYKRKISQLELERRSMIDKHFAAMDAEAAKRRAGSTASTHSEPKVDKSVSDLLTEYTKYSQELASHPVTRKVKSIISAHKKANNGNLTGMRDVNDKIERLQDDSSYIKVRNARDSAYNAYRNLTGKSPN